MENPRSLQVVLRAIVCAAVIVSAAVVALPHGGRSAAAPPNTTAAPVPQPNAATVDLGGGFTFGVVGTDINLTIGCAPGYLYFANYDGQTGGGSFVAYVRDGALRSGTQAFTPTPHKLYKFGCDREYQLATGEVPSKIAPKCVAFTEQDNVLSPHIMACAVTYETWDSDAQLRPEMFVFTEIGKSPVEGLKGYVWAGGCRGGDIVQVSLDGAAVQQFEANGFRFARRDVLTLNKSLTKGTHTLSLSCEYSDAQTANKPSPAYRGACVTLTVTDVVSQITDCSGPDPVIRGFDITKDGSQMIGACRGYGFAAYLTDPTGAIKANFAVIGANHGDIAKVMVPITEQPTNFVVSSCRVNMEGATDSTLECHHVIKTDGNYYLEWKKCPFTTVSFVDTL